MEDFTNTKKPYVIESKDFMPKIPPGGGYLSKEQPCTTQRRSRNLQHQIGIIRTCLRRTPLSSLSSNPPSPTHSPTSPRRTPPPQAPPRVCNPCVIASPSTSATKASPPPMSSTISQRPSQVDCIG